MDKADVSEVFVSRAMSFAEFMGAVMWLYKVGRQVSRHILYRIHLRKSVVFDRTVCPTPYKMEWMVHMIGG